MVANTNWTETTLDECAVWLSGGTPSKSNPEFWAGDIPWISAKDMKTFRLRDAEDHISAAAIGKGGKVVPAGTILLLVRGMTLHNDVPIGIATRDVAFNQDIKALKTVDGVDSQFLAYWLLAHKPDLLASVDSAGHGTGRLATDTLKGKRVMLPPLPEQKAIARILGTLDDKIELNRRMNATLEAMARALFQSWFIDFDPVRRKSENRKVRSEKSESHDLSNFSLSTSHFDHLFPDSFQPSELGEIPKGWSLESVGNVFHLTMGQSPPGDTYNELGNGMPFYQGRTDFGFRFPTRRMFCTAPTRVAKARDTLVSVRAPVGDINMAIEDCCIGRGVAAVRHKQAAASFTYYAMANLRPNFANYESEGTVFGAINKANFEKLPIINPSHEILTAFEKIAGPIDEQIRANETQSRTLATLRDSLLPKLLSGEPITPL